MSRLHEALRRAAGGEAPILPPDAGIDGGKDAGPSQQAFTSAWALDAQPGEGQAAAAGAAGQAAGGDLAATLFRTKPFEGERHLANEKLVLSIATTGAPDLSVAVEQYRKLAATLHHAQGERGLKLVMVTSTNPGEGKSLTASNLSLTLSGSYERRVLLVDGDLRRPSLHDVFRVPNSTGLSDSLLANHAQGGLAVFEVAQRMSLLPSGNPMADPTGILTSAAMRRLLEAARARYDWTIVDTPPVGLLSDARHLSDMVDGVLLVVEAGVTQYQEILKAIDIVGRERLLGVVLNRLPFTQNATHYYSQYYGRPRSDGA